MGCSRSVAICCSFSGGISETPEEAHSALTAPTNPASANSWAPPELPELSEVELAPASELGALERDSFPAPSLPLEPDDETPAAPPPLRSSTPDVPAELLLPTASAPGRCVRVSQALSESAAHTADTQARPPGNVRWRMAV